MFDFTFFLENPLHIILKLVTLQSRFWFVCGQSDNLSASAAQHKQLFRDSIERSLRSPQNLIVAGAVVKS